MYQPPTTVIEALERDLNLTRIRVEDAKDQLSRKLHRAVVDAQNAQASWDEYQTATESAMSAIESRGREAGAAYQELIQFLRKQSELEYLLDLARNPRVEVKS